MVTDTKSSYINAQSATGVRLGHLEQSNAFGRYDFGWGPEPWWIPELDFYKIMDQNFPGCDLYSRQAMLEKIPRYSSWKAFWHAVLRAGSAYHFYVDGPLVVTAVNSFTAGTKFLQATMAERARAGQQKGFLLVWCK